MAERWQQWMPFHIDRFRGSPDVQAMHPAARCGYLYLLAAAWQTDDCSLPDDDLDLAAASGLGDELWALYAPRIRRKFLAENGRLINEALRREWEDSREVYERRKTGAQRTNRTRNDRERSENVPTAKTDDAVRTLNARSTHAQRTQYARSVDTGTGTGTEVQERERASCEIVYLAYPRQIGKEAALKAISHAAQRLAAGRDMPAMALPEALEYLRKRAGAYARSPAGQREKFTPHPATWFNGGRYLDDDAEWEEASDANLGTSRNGGVSRGSQRVEQAIHELRKAGVEVADRRPEDPAAEVRSAAQRRDGCDATGVVLEGSG